MLCIWWISFDFIPAHLNGQSEWSVKCLLARCYVYHTREITKLCFYMLRHLSKPVELIKHTDLNNKLRQQTWRVWLCPESGDALALHLIITGALPSFTLHINSSRRLFTSYYMSWPETLKRKWTILIRMVVLFNTFTISNYFEATSSKYKPLLHLGINKYCASFISDKRLHRRAHHFATVLRTYFEQSWMFFLLLQWLPWSMAAMVNLFYLLM